MSTLRVANARAAEIAARCEKATDGPLVFGPDGDSLITFIAAVRSDVPDLLADRAALLAALRACVEALVNGCVEVLDEHGIACIGCTRRERESCETDCPVSIALASATALGVVPEGEP